LFVLSNNGGFFFTNTKIVRKHSGWDCVGNCLLYHISQKLYVEDAVKCSLKQVEEEHRLAVAIKIASSDDEECEAKEI
jgi:hypothetical protein